MVRKQFDVEVPDGQHLGLSRGTDGAYRAHLFDDETNDLPGHAELFETSEHDIDEPNVQYVYVSEPRAGEGRELTDEELAELLRAVVGLGIIVSAFASRAAPHVQKWWQDAAIPALKSARSNTVRTVSATWKSVAALWQAPGVAPHVSATDTASRETQSTELEVAFKEYTSSMGSTEARERFVAALIARAFSEEQLRLLRDAHIEDDGDSGDLRTAMESLTAQQVGKTITLMLEKDPSLLNQASLTELGTILGGGQAQRSIPLVLGLPPLKDQ
ncbi:hypothetical protein [Paenarthrobacter sp. NPDC057981]|uniref:hypothetical protein n=1 Tax=Paenarthrobacter sp. NPDC057981 TaxID=3346297 RepID=UPI0036DCCFD6